MIKSETRICPLCSRKIVKYKHTLTRIMIKGLRELYNAGGKARLDKLNLSNSEFTNFQKLRYFGLAYNDRYEWTLTELGTLFLAGKIKVNKTVCTENAVVIAKSTDKVAIEDVKSAAQFKIEWRDQASQVSLFDYLKKFVEVVRE